MFSKKTPLEPKPMASRSAAGATFSVLGADIAITGDIRAAADLHIDGKVEGDIACASLVQGESSEVLGAIAAESARLAGTVRGSITTRELVILKTARIHGDVHYDALTIEQGAQVDGRLSPRGAALPPDVGASDGGEAHLILASSTS
jgi:cytoskeletal protein CcmA (bactofilin family)